MKLKIFQNGDDRAVSPVIGVILMVAITVVLAAVIGMFVMGMGDDLGNNAPSASVGASIDGTNVTFTHNGGDTFAEGTLYLVDGDSRGSTSVNSATEFGAGQTITEGFTSTSGTVSLVYDDGSSSATVATAEI